MTSASNQHDTLERSPQRTVRRSKETRPGELVRAGREMFATKGFAATRLEDVAEKAGVSKGTIYLYFRSKEVLFEEVVKAGLAPVAATLAALATETDLRPPEQLRRFLAIWQRVVAEAGLGDLLKLLAAEADNFPEAAQWLGESVVGPAKEVMAGVVEAGIAGGDFRAISAETVVDILASPLCLYALSDVWGGLSSPDRFVGEAFEMIIRGLGAPSAK